MNKKRTSSVIRQTKFFFELLKLIQMDGLFLVVLRLFEVFYFHPFYF